MTDKKKLYSEHITAAKDWLGKAEESIAKDNDIRSDLNIMLAQAELQRAKEKDDTALIRKWLKWILPWITAIGIAVGYVYFLRPELFTTVREESPAEATCSRIARTGSSKPAISTIVSIRLSASR